MFWFWLNTNTFTNGKVANKGMVHLKARNLPKSPTSLCYRDALMNL